MPPAAPAITTGTEHSRMAGSPTRRRPLAIAVLGSTGSIGRSTLEVIAASGGRMRPHLLAAHTSTRRLVEQARAMRPDWVVVVDEAAAEDAVLADLPEGTRLAVGSGALCDLIREPAVDRVVSAVVGAAGLESTWAAVDAGKTVALANKETLVMAGPLVMRLAAERSALIVPVDSEHSAILQAIRAGRPREISRLILTASGGPFRTLPADRFAAVTPAEALRHPTWSMGPKITIDSATMMNKALELIEARWLFDVPAERIEVVVHPQSIVHSMVEFEDGAVVAQLGPPDMRLPIQYALDYPDRHPGPARRLDFTENISLEFEPPDQVRFPALAMGREAAARGGTAGAVLNAANEEAVRLFLEGELPFTGITAACRRALDRHAFVAEPTLEELRGVDAWARSEVAGGERA